MTRITLAALIITALMAFSGSMPGIDPPAGAISAGGGCEPSEMLDVRAAVVAMQPSANGARVTVEVTVSAHLPVVDARVVGWELEDDGASRRPRFEEALGPVARDSIRSRRYFIDIEGASEHHLLFSVDGEDPAGRPLASSAYVRVDLDPARQPTRTGGLVQYRGRTDAGSEP